MCRDSRLDRLLEWLEENIDEDHARGVIKRHHDCIMFKTPDFVPLAVWVTGPCDFEPVDRAEALGNPELMMYNELLYSFGSVYNSVSAGDDQLYQIRSNQGVGLIASMFGANCRVVNGMSWVDHMEKEALYAAADRGIPSMRAGLAGRALDDCAYFARRLEGYPKCGRCIRITQPDLQGPFDIAHLLMGPDIFYEVCDEPDRLHGLLEVVTETFISFVNEAEPLLTGFEEGGMVVHGGMYGGRALIKDDTAAINLSREMYEEFSGQYNHKIMQELGGASLHHCGLERDWHFDCFADPGLKGLNFGQPQFHQLENKLARCEKHKIPIIGWNHDLERDSVPMRDFYRLSPKTGLTLSCTAGSVEQAREIHRVHIERCLAQSGS